MDRRIACGELIELEGLHFETVGDHPGFYLSGAGIVFYFQQYEYFPYAAGIQEFTIPYGALSGMLKDGYGLISAEPVALEAGALNTVADGNTAFLTLPGNPSTGYVWRWTIADPTF
jgi:inhibitor of cysteine peptidase